MHIEIIDKIKRIANHYLLAKISGNFIGFILLLMIFSQYLPNKLRISKNSANTATTKFLLSVAF